LILFPKKGDKKKDKPLKNLENQKHGKVNLNQKIDNKDNNTQEKAIDGNNKFENKINNEISSSSINQRFQEIEKKLENQNEENKKLKEQLNLTDLKAIIQEQKINVLTNKNIMFLNAYKILYFRKIANILLDKIFVKYS
jgi:hypothetical protein